MIDHCLEVPPYQIFLLLYINFNLNVVGNGEDDDETDEESGDAYNFSDPEADWITETA